MSRSRSPVQRQAHSQEGHVTVRIYTSFDVVEISDFSKVFREEREEILRFIAGFAHHVMDDRGRSGIII